MPFVNLLIELLLIGIFKGLDTGCTCNKRKTKSKNIHQFLDMYTGADFNVDLSYLYGDHLSIVFMAMFFGIGMPVMFPMAAINFANQQLVQRMRLAFMCRQPPLLNNELSDEVLNLLQWAPVFMVFNAYWMLDNQQIFGNKWSYIRNVDMSMPSRHYFNELHLS